MLNVKVAALAATVSAVFALPVSAQAVISNGTIQLGVDSYGQLNIPTNDSPSAGGTVVTGLRDLRTNYEATAPGCLCEGWGVADLGAGISGSANNDYGVSGLTFVSFDSTASTVTTVSRISDLLEIKHEYKPSANSNLYQVDVTITNLAAVTSGDIVYRRVMDWDIEPTAFEEYSTIQGTAGAENVLFASNDGFATADPLAGPSDIGYTGDFKDAGTDDHGALFDLKFSPIEAGGSLILSIFYGAAPTEREALTSLASVGAEIYSLGQAADDINGTGPDRSTFIFGFKGVGGVVVDPGAVPEPATWAMMIAGFGLVGAAARRRRPVAVTA